MAYTSSKKRWTVGGLVASLLAFASPSIAANVPSLASKSIWDGPFFAYTEAQFVLGKLKNPFTKANAWTPIVTLQHASTNPFGDIFFFIDFVDDRLRDGYYDRDAYGEGYLYLSSAKIAGINYGDGLIKDVGVVGGVNIGVDSHFRAWTPGVYVDLNVPGFTFLRLMFTAYIDDSTNEIGRAGRGKDGWNGTISWAYPFQLGNQYFSFGGYAEFVTKSRSRTYGNKQYDWILAEPQLRWDAGYAAFGVKDKFFVGTEFHYWMNKLGTKEDEARFQALAVVRF